MSTLHKMNTQIKNVMSRILNTALVSAALLGTANLRANSNIVFANEPLTPLQNGRFNSSRFGDLSIISANQESIIVWSHAKNSFIQHASNGRFFSWEFGDIQLGEHSRWLYTSRFGWVHFGENEQTFNGWIYSDKFDWMKIERPENNVYIWLSKVHSWAEIATDNTLYTFEWGTLQELGPNRFRSSRFGIISSEDSDGWVFSELFGWLWVPGGGEWFWAHDRGEWLGIVEGDKIWSTAENRILPVTPPLEELIGTRGPGGGFLWKPIAESTGNLVVLLPRSLTDSNREAWIKDQDGNIIEKARYGGVHNGGREHYFFSRRGNAYQNVFVVSYDSAGNLVHWPIANGAGRITY